MTLLTEEPLVRENRLLSSSEKADIVSETQALFAHLQDNTGGNLKEMVSAMHAATKCLVYACFGFKLMRSVFPAFTDGAWKQFVKEKFPAQVKNARTYIIIGKHFKYDEKYLKFLDSMDYAVPSSERMVRAIGSQLKELQIGTPKELIEHFESGRYIRELQPTTHIPSPVEEKVKVQELETVTDDLVTDTADQEELFCDALLDKIIVKASVLATVKNAFQSLVGRRAVDKLNPVKIGLLREALRNAQEILDQMK